MQSSQQVETDLDKVFNQYLNHNRKLWLEFSPPDHELSKKVIIADLMVESPGYLLGSCIVAKYLQKKTNATIYGLVRRKTSLLALSVAHSFGIKNAIYKETQPNFEVDVDWDEMFAGKTIEQKRKIILDFKIDNVVIGDLAYDTYLRATGMGTIEEVNEEVINHILQTMRDYYFYSTISQQLGAFASVQGHIVYSQYGALSRAIIKNGGTVYAKKPGTGPLTVRRYRDFENLKKHEYTFSKAEFDHIYNNHKDEAIKFSEAFLLKKAPSLYTTHIKDGIEAYASDKKLYEKEELYEQLDLNPDYPCVFLMCHVFPDAVHNAVFRLYDDNLVWLRDTLELIKDIPNVNWIVKSHPHNVHYRSVHSATEEALAYVNEYSHIANAPEDINTASLFKIANAVITVGGSAGLEFPSVGVPAITTGSAFYTGLGFTIEPQSLDEYKKVLEDVPKLQRLTQEDREKAQVCAYMYYLVSRAKSNLVPELPGVFWKSRDDVEIWNEALAAIADFKFEDDPLYNSFNRQLDMDSDHLWNTDFIKE